MFTLPHTTMLTFATNNHLDKDHVNNNYIPPQHNSLSQSPIGELQKWINEL